MGTTTRCHCVELAQPGLTAAIVLQRVTLEEELKALMTPVRKNTTDLEAGLSELAELSHHVEVEMGEQRETLDQLLEEMQKTISIEVTRRARRAPPFCVQLFLTPARLSCVGHTRLA